MSNETVIELPEQNPRAIRKSTPMSGRLFLMAAIAIWLLTAMIILAVRAHAIGTHDFLDGDDQLRLVQVRDWLGGQSFYDVTQYRMNQPWGAPMHWSRLVDMPLAGMILLLRPFLGAVNAETVAVVIVPLVTLGIIMVLAGLIGRKLADSKVGLVSVIFIALSLPVVLQTLPLRIDHHGWEIACSMVALFAALDRNGQRSGIVSGLSLAVALQISLEVLPFAAAVGVVAGVRWIRDSAPEQRLRLAWFTGTLAVVEIILFALLHAPQNWSAAYCDAISPPQLVMLAMTAVGVLGLTTINPLAPRVRLIGLGTIALIAAGAFHGYPPHCGLDAFSSLDPLTRKLWYEGVLEGQPIWNVPLLSGVFSVGFPLVGLLCAVFALTQAEPDRQPLWVTYIMLLFAAFAVTIMVQRATSFATAAAVPAAAWMLLRTLARARAIRSVLVRVISTVGCCCLLSPLAPAAVVNIVFPSAPDREQMSPIAPSCNATEDIQGLSVLPTSRLLAPLDLGPAILMRTPHAPLASGHHRNHVAMSQVIAAFTSDAAVAHSIVHDRGLRYIVMCPHMAEILRYQKYAPTGFAAQLIAERPISWLIPITIQNNPIRVWKVLN